MRPSHHQEPHEHPSPHLPIGYKVIAPPAEEAHPRLKGGLPFLLDSYSYACELGRDRWEFAVEIESLHRGGLINNDLRWLIGKGYLEHAIETESLGKGPRRFRRADGFKLGRQSCFVLTDAGVGWAQRLLLHSITDTRGSSEEKSSAEGGQALQAERPYWDAEQHSLYWRGEVVKHFKREAPCQEAVLAAFQGCHWMRYVIVMLPRDEGVNPKERLHETIKNLNRSCGGRIRFTQEGNGGRVGWQQLE